MTNYFHPTAIISPKAIIGQNNYFGPFVVVYDNVVIGNDNHFTSHISVGSPAEHKNPGFNPALNEQTNKFVYIGNGNTFREFITINTPTTSDKTYIGNNCYIMRGCHCSHDSVIEDDVIMSCNVTLGGFTYVMNAAYLAIGSITHQYSIIGSYAMLGMGTITTKTSRIEPGKIYVGSPATFLKDNKIGLDRNNVSDEDLSKNIDRYRVLLGYL